MENRKRSVLLIYGEETEGISIRVPKSKKIEIRERFYAILREYENPTTVLVDCPIVVEAKTKIPPKVIKADYVESEIVGETIGYEYTATIPLGTNPINIIGHNLYKHYSDEIYYIRLPDRRIVVLHSEAEVKKFIRKELIK